MPELIFSLKDISNDRIKQAAIDRRREMLKEAIRRARLGKEKALHRLTSNPYLRQHISQLLETAETVFLSGDPEEIVRTILRLYTRAISEGIHETMHGLKGRFATRRLNMESIFHVDKTDRVQGKEVQVEANFKAEDRARAENILSIGARRKFGLPEPGKDSTPSPIRAPSLEPKK